MIPIASPAIGDDELNRIEAVLEDGQLADGPEVRAFEDEFASYCDADYAVATANGTAALHAALVALDIGPGDRVLTTPFSFIASANAARLVGADVGFVDIDEHTYNIDPTALADRLESGEEVDAVIAVHLFGLPADMTALRSQAASHDFDLIEDAAQAHGATIDGDRVGAIGDVGCFSFYPTKNMTTAEGGMIVTDRADVANAASRFVDHGRESGYRFESVGHNFRMTSIAAAIGRTQLEKLPTFTEQRRENAARFDDAFEALPVSVPQVPENRTHVYHQYTIQHENRDRLQQRLADRGVDTGVYYPIPIHRQPPYDRPRGTAPVAEAAADSVLSLPVHPSVTEEMIDRIVEGVSTAVEVVQ